MRSALSPALIALAAAALAGCSSGGDSHDSTVARARTAPAPRTERTIPAPKGIAGPRRVETSGKFAAAVVEKSLGTEVSQGQPVVIGARCHAGNCVIRYRSEARGNGVVLNAQSDILRRLFARASTRSVTLYVNNQQVGTPDKNNAPAFATTRCRRIDHPQSGAPPFACRSTHVPGGRQRSLVRRGLLTNEEASRGRGDPSGGPPNKK